jgi:hypothetical protein
MKTKWVAVGIILLFVGTISGGALTDVGKKPLGSRGVISHVPMDGLYWNDRRIAEYPVPLYLHYYFKLQAVFQPRFLIDDNITGIELVEFYLDGALIAEVTSPPWDFYCRLTVIPFHHSHTYGIKVYCSGGETYSDTITIYRLFP